MPTYVTQPILSQGPVAGQANQSQVTIPCLSPGIPGYSFGRATGYKDAPTQNTEIGETYPSNGTAGRQFAIRSFAGFSENSEAIGWEVTAGSSVKQTVTLGTTAVNFVRCRVTDSTHVTLQGAFRDVEAEYYTLDTIAMTAGGTLIAKIVT